MELLGESPVASGSPATPDLLMFASRCGPQVRLWEVSLEDVFVHVVGADHPAKIPDWP
jgi:hypothetical protein